jgi:ABC-type phosphate/phosphonate transport system substrate-binding protein
MSLAVPTLTYVPPGLSGRRKEAEAVALAPLYDLPELRAANDALWAEIRVRLARRGWDAPEALSRQRPNWDQALFGQTCGYRYISELADRVTPVAAPRYHAHGADGAFLRSAVLVRVADKALGVGDLRGRRLAYQRTDLSSANLLRAEIAPLAGDQRYFARLAPAASFVACAEAVAEGDADAGLLDAAALAHLTRLRPTTARKLRLLAWTARSPAPPFVAAQGLDRAVVRALGAALWEIEQEPGLRDLRAELLIDGFDPMPKAQYKAALHLEQIAETQGYPTLR